MFSLCPGMWRGEVARLVVGFQPLQEERGSLFFMGITSITIIYVPVGSGRGGAPQVGPGGRYCVPCGWAGAFPRPRGAAPWGPACPGRGPHFSREMGRKRAGGLCHR